MTAESSMVACVGSLAVRPTAPVFPEYVQDWEAEDDWWLLLADCESFWPIMFSSAVKDHFRLMADSCDSHVKTYLAVARQPYVWPCDFVADFFKISMSNVIMYLS